MRRITATTAAAAVACAGLGLMVPGAAHAESAGFQGCYGFGRVTLSPGVTASPAQNRFQLAQNLGPCRLPDASILSGTMTGVGEGSLSCVAGQGAGRFLVRWENGRTSAGTFSFGTSGPHLFGSGSIAQGEFAGDRFGISGDIEPRHSEDCTSGGVKEATSYEAIGVSPR